MNFGVDKVKAAVIAIDLHRGHMDLSVATMPVKTQAQADRVLGNAAKLFAWCREQDWPVIHLVTTYRDVPEIRSNPFWRTRGIAWLHGDAASDRPQKRLDREHQKTLRLLCGNRSGFHFESPWHQHANHHGCQYQQLRALNGGCGLFSGLRCDRPE